MKQLRWLGLAALISVAGVGRPLGAQGYFGQNQVQYDRFKWRVLETDHFLVHYYPEEREAVVDAARMAERSYAKLSRMLNHQFREKKPLILYSSRGDYGQNNMFGDLGEFTGGITEALRHRIVLPFTGDYKSFEHVLTHELVHAFQYDIFARGRAGGGLQTLAQVQPPLWMMEGMAEYLSLGPEYPITNTIMRDAALNGRIPTVEDMAYRPDRFNPYDYGEALWAYIGKRWGDEVIGEIMNSVPNVGIDRAFKRELGLSLEELGDEWKEAIQVKHLPQIASLDRARKFAQPLLTERRTGSRAFFAPSLSPDGKYIAFISTGSFLRGEVFPDLWLGNAETGKRIKRLVKTTLDPNFEELRLLYSQSAFSPDGKLLAFTAQRNGRDVLYLLDVKKRTTKHRFDLPLEGVTSPSWSPDGKRIVLSGSNGGITDLFVVDVEGKQVQRLTNDRFGDLQPQWSPDGKTIAFASDRGDDTDFDLLRFNKWRISTYDIETGRVEVLPNQAGLNINPMWSPDGKSIAYVSDRTGIQNLFLYDLASKEQYKLTNVIGAVSAATEYSPAITWARQVDRLAFVYFEDGEWSIWSISNPEKLKGQPYRDPTTVVAANTAGGVKDTTRGAAQNGAVPGTQLTPPPQNGIPQQAGTPTVAQAGTSNVTSATDTTRRTASDSGKTLAQRNREQEQVSLFRTPNGFRPSADLPISGETGETTFTVAQLLDSAAMALPDTNKFREYAYRVGFQPEYISRPAISYAQDNFGRGVFGGTTIILSDLLGNNRLAFAGQMNGRLSEAWLYAGYTNLARRVQFTTGVSQQPIWFLQGLNYGPYPGVPGAVIESTQLARYVVRQAFGIGIYPLNRFTRLEFGAQMNNVERSIAWIRRGIELNTGQSTQFVFDSITNRSALNYFAPYGAYVSDNTLFGYTGPISGRRYRFQVEPTIGNLQWVDYQADYRRYFPILFNFLTFATRVQSSVAVGRNEEDFPKYIGRPEFVRGYDREQINGGTCGVGIGGATDPSQNSVCSANELIGSRVAFANAELRFPLVRRFDLGLLPISLPPVDGLFFYDAGVAWNGGQSVYWSAPDNYDVTRQRRVIRSYGFGVRLNLFGFALVRWDYAKPLDRPGQKAYWQWTLGPSF